MRILRMSLLFVLLISAISFAGQDGSRGEINQGNVFCSILAHCNGWEIYWQGICISGPDKLGRHETITIQLPYGDRVLTAKFYYNDTLMGQITDEVHVIPGTIMHCFVETN